MKAFRLILKQHTSLSPRKEQSMKFTRIAPRGYVDVRDECTQLTLTAEDDSDTKLITAVMKFICNDDGKSRRVADVSRACTAWAEARLP